MQHRQLHRRLGQLASLGFQLAARSQPRDDADADQRREEHQRADRRPAETAPAGTEGGRVEALVLGAVSDVSGAGRRAPDTCRVRRLDLGVVAGHAVLEASSGFIGAGFLRQAL